jgi:hypothetical protein
MCGTHMFLNFLIEHTFYFYKKHNPSRNLDKILPISSLHAGFKTVVSMVTRKIIWQKENNIKFEIMW